MKNVTVVILLVIVLAVAAVMFSQSRPSQNNKQQANVTQAPTEATQPTAAMQEGKVNEISMTAKQWVFEPSTVRVKEGEKVRLKIKSVDVNHGFAIPEFNVNLSLSPNKEETAEFVASKKGEFTFFCSVLCGKGHKDMKGKIIVE